MRYGICGFSTVIFFAMIIGFSGGGSYDKTASSYNGYSGGSSYDNYYSGSNSISPASSSYSGDSSSSGSKWNL